MIIHQLFTKAELSYPIPNGFINSGQSTFQNDVDYQVAKYWRRIIETNGAEL